MVRYYTIDTVWMRGDLPCEEVGILVHEILINSDFVLQLGEFGPTTAVQRGHILDGLTCSARSAVTVVKH